MSDDYTPDDTPSINAIRAVASLRHPIERPNPVPHRIAVRSLLEDLASGKTDSDTMWFAQELANCLLAADSEAPKSAHQRAQLIMAAVGLAGTEDKHDRFCSRVQALKSFRAGTRNAIELSLEYFPNPSGLQGEDLFIAAESIWYKKQKDYPPL